MRHYLCHRMVVTNIDIQGWKDIQLLSYVIILHSDSSIYIRKGSDLAWFYKIRIANFSK